jgi:hypothetical protein
MKSSVMDQFAKMMEQARPINAPTLAKILSVNESMLTCKVSFADGRPTHERVLLESSPDAEFVRIPAVGSIVLVGFADNILTRAFIFKFSKLQKILMKTSGGKLEISISDSGYEIKTGKGVVSIGTFGTVIGSGTAEPMVKGATLSKWAASVDLAISSLLKWAGTGIAPGPTGGIAPLSGVEASEFASSTLSKENKVV